jgi:tetratricopeptide (TPR) repeat protein
MDPNNATIWLNKDWDLGKLDRHDEEIKWQSVCVGFVTLHRITHDEAIKCYDKYLETDPSYVDAWNGKARSLADIKKNKEALYVVEKSLEIVLTT